MDEKDGYITLTTAQVRIELNKQTGLMKVFNPLTGKCVIEEVAPVIFGPKEVTVTLKENPEEYFYGGGVQNGRSLIKARLLPSKIRIAGRMAEWPPLPLSTGLPMVTE